MPQSKFSHKYTIVNMCVRLNSIVKTEYGLIPRLTLTLTTLAFDSVITMVMLQYFDKNGAAALHHTLNETSTAFIGNVLDVPYAFILTLVKLVQRSLTLWYLSPTMFMWGPGVTIPLYMGIMVLSWSTQRRVRGQANRSKNSASGNTLETLQKIATVRQFTMEDKEVSTYVRICAPSKP